MWLAVVSPSNDYVDQPADPLFYGSSRTLTIKKACRINAYALTYTGARSVGSIQIKGVSYDIRLVSTSGLLNSTPIELATGDTITFRLAGAGNNDFASCITLA